MALLPCRECGKEISSEAQACPHCGVPNPTQPTEVQSARKNNPVIPVSKAKSKSRKGCFLPILFLAGMFFIGHWLWIRLPVIISSTLNSISHLPSVSSISSPSGQVLPKKEQNLINIWNNYDTQFNNAPNSIIANEINTKFNQIYCEAIPTGHVSNWIGVIKVITTDNSSGGIILFVDINPNSDALNFAVNLDLITDLNSSIAPSGTLFYLDNDSTDIATQRSYVIANPTLIAQNTLLYNTAVQLRIGDVIEFSGDFIPRNLDLKYPFDCEGGFGYDDLSLFRFDAINKKGNS